MLVCVRKGRLSSIFYPALCFWLKTLGLVLVPFFLMGMWVDFLVHTEPFSKGIFLFLWEQNNHHGVEL